MIKDIDLSPLNDLAHDIKPQWGKMTPQHMVEHLVEAVKLSNGKINLTECMTHPEKLPIMKKILMSPRPLPKNFVNTVIGAELKPYQFNNLNEALQRLSIELDDIDVFFEINPEANPMNPTFGPLNKEEWIQFHKKHFRHHFLQFGLIQENK